MIEYDLTRQELQEYLQCLDWKKQRIVRQIHLWFIAIIGVLCTIQFARAQEFYWIALGGCCLLLLFAIVYGGTLQRKRKENKIWNKGRHIKFEIPKQDVTKVLVTDNSIILQQKDKSFYVPVRCLGKQENVEKIIREANCPVVEIQM